MATELVPVGCRLIDGKLVQTVNARRLHSFLGVGRDFSSWIKGRIDQYGFEEGVDFLIYTSIPQNGGLAKEYHISLDMGKELGMVERNDKGREIRRYFIECERKVKEAHTTDLSLPQDYATALRALANEVEQKELAIKQRDEAVRTKAEIGCRREATAMATASAATRKANKLENELGIGREWRSTKAISWALHYFANSRGMWMVLGKKLASLSVEMGYEVRKIEDERYGKVNSYHVDVIEKLRQRIVADDNMMGKYRKQEGA